MKHHIAAICLLIFPLIAQAEKTAAPEPRPSKVTTTGGSIFEDALVGKLVRLDGDQLTAYTEHKAPKKYYVFYYTASWCGPCKRFTPSLVEWYNKNKNENFELVLISSDRKEENMLKYTLDKHMPWPQLQFDQIKDFRAKFDHGVRSIPSLIVCDLDGKNLGNFRRNLLKLTEMVVD